MTASATHENAPLSQQRAMNDTLTRLAHFCYVCVREARCARGHESKSVHEGTCKEKFVYEGTYE